METDREIIDRIFDNVEQKLSENQALHERIDFLEKALRDMKRRKNIQRDRAKLAEQKLIEKGIE